MSRSAPKRMSARQSSPPLVEEKGRQQPDRDRHQEGETDDLGAADDRRRDPAAGDPFGDRSVDEKAEGQTRQAALGGVVDEGDERRESDRRAEHAQRLEEPTGAADGASRCDGRPPGLSDVGAPGLPARFGVVAGAVFVSSSTPGVTTPFMPEPRDELRGPGGRVARPL